MTSEHGDSKTPNRIYGKRKKVRGKEAAEWRIRLTKREEQMLDQLVHHFDYPRAILGRMLLRDAYRQLFGDEPKPVAIASGVPGE